MTGSEESSERAASPVVIKAFVGDEFEVEVAVRFTGEHGVSYVEDLEIIGVRMKHVEGGVCATMVAEPDAIF